MAQNKITLGKEVQVKSIDKTTYTNVDVVCLSPLGADAKQPTCLVDGCVRIINKEGAELKEVEDGGVDSALNKDAFCIGSDKVIKLIVEKGKVPDVADAKKKFDGMEIFYDYRDDLKLDPDNFDLKVFDSTGKKIYDSCPITLEQAYNILSMYSKTFEVKEMGVPTYCLQNMTI